MLQRKMLKKGYFENTKKIVVVNGNFFTLEIKV